MQPCRQADRLRIEIKLIHQERIGMAGFDPIGRQRLGRKVLDIEGENQIGRCADGGCQQMTIIGVQQDQRWDEIFEVGYQGVANVCVHQLTGAIQLFLLEFRAISEHPTDAKPTDTLLVTCRSGERAAKAINLLADAGYKNVYNIIDGVEGDKVTDPANVFFGKRMKNGCKNSAPWVYDLDPEKIILEEAATRSVPQ